MSDKYIIRNCPATGAGCCGDTCPEITDCPLKQIVELCKEECFCPNATKEIQDIVRVGVNALATEILKLLDIQEVE